MERFSDRRSSRPDRRSSDSEPRSTETSFRGGHPPDLGADESEIGGPVAEESGADSEDSAGRRRLEDDGGDDAPIRASIPDNASRPGVWSRLPVLLLMSLVLVAAGLLSAMTAMRYAVRGREVVVPELAGLTQTEAAAILFDQGLELDVEGSRFSNDVPEGEIIDQRPAAGSTVKRARDVQVLLSLGERRFPVPDIQGASLRSAQMLLAQRGLAMGNMLYAHTGEGSPSTVLYQSPSAGDTGAVDPSVDVLVSLGPDSDYFVMPDLRGRTARDVTARVAREGFQMGETTYRAQPGVEPGRVVAQQPPAGYRVSKDDIIRIEVSQ